MARRRSTLDIGDIDRVVQHSVTALRSGYQQISTLTDVARSEYSALQERVREIKMEIEACIGQADYFARQLAEAKKYLAEVNRDFSRYDEGQIKSVYARTQALEVDLAVVRERETLLQRKRRDLERGISGLGRVVERAESMGRQMGIAMYILAGDLENALLQIESLQKKSILATRIIRAQEEERRRVARDIHDGPAQAMANLIVRTEICERLLDGDRSQLAEELMYLKSATQGILQDMRRIMFNLRPMILDDLGLVPALRRYLNSVEKGTSDTIDLIVLGSVRRLPETVEVAVFRLIQEAVSNAQKYARANRIAVRIEFVDGLINVQVKDDGCGFDLDAVRSRARDDENLGLLSMEERVDLLRGTLKLDSAPGKGTLVSISIPVDSD